MALGIESIKEALKALLVDVAQLGEVSLSKQ